MVAKTNAATIAASGAHAGTAARLPRAGRAPSDGGEAGTTPAGTSGRDSDPAGSEGGGTLGIVRRFTLRRQERQHAPRGGVGYARRSGGSSASDATRRTPGGGA